MAKTKSVKILKFIFILSLPILIFKCANQMSPGGGEIDKIPPEIIDVYPEFGTINFQDNFFELTFSEYVDKRSVQDAIFVSPALEGELKYDWSGKTLEISFKDTLRSNTTYTVTIGTDVVDYNNRNRMAQAFNLIFSTGNEIDKGQIEGKIYDKDPAGVMVFAYRKSDSLFNPSKFKPDYISQVGRNGFYKLMGMSDGEYRVLAVRDEYRDFIYNIEQDQFGAPYTDVTINDTDSLFTDLNFFLAIEDTTPPHLVSAVMTDINHILVEFSENIDSSLISADNFSVIDSTSGNIYKTNYFYKGQAKQNHFFVTVTDTLREENQVYIECKNFTDKYSNATMLETANLSVSTKPDTLPVKLLKTISEYENKVVDFETPYIIFYFDDAFARTGITDAVKIVDSKENQIAYRVTNLDDASFRIDISGRLKPKSDYTAEIQFGLLTDAAGNRLDSLYKIKFTTINNLDFTGISGRIFIQEDSVKPLVVMQNVDRKEKVYKQVVNKDAAFDFKKIMPGKYIVWSFIDENRNNEYDRGSINPYLPAERFVFYPDTINARARWPVGDVFVNFK